MCVVFGLFSQLNMSSLEIIESIIFKIIVLISLGLLKMFFDYLLLVEHFGRTWHTALTMSFDFFICFTADYMLTSEIASTMANDKEKEG